MKEIFVTSDLHLRHNKPFLYEPRGFTSIEEHDEAIVERWNSVVKEDDLVFNLGDMALIDAEGAIPYIQRLNGNQIWVLGNHDNSNKVNIICNACPRIALAGILEYASCATVIKHRKLNIYLSHYPTIVSNFDDKHFSQHVINFYGHTHQRTNFLSPTNPFMYHVGMDSHNCTPVNIEEAISDIRNRWNEIGQLPTSMKPEDLYPYME